MSKSAIVEKRDVYKLSLSKGEVFVMGELSSSDLEFVKIWLDRVEFTQQSEQSIIQVFEYTPESGQPNVEIIESSAANPAP